MTDAERDRIETEIITWKKMVEDLRRGAQKPHLKDVTSTDYQWIRTAVNAAINWSEHLSDRIFEE